MRLHSGNHRCTHPAYIAVFFDKINTLDYIGLCYIRVGHRTEICVGEGFRRWTLIRHVLPWTCRPGQGSATAPVSRREWSFFSPLTAVFVCSPSAKSFLLLEFVCLSSKYVAHTVESSYGPPRSVYAWSTKVVLLWPVSVLLLFLFNLTNLLFVCQWHRLVRVCATDRMLVCFVT